MINRSIFSILQFAGGTFPGGGFSQSWGLETYVENGVVNDIVSLTDFLDTYINVVIGKSEVPIVIHSMKTVENKFINNNLNKYNSNEDNSNEYSKNTLFDDELISLKKIEELSIASKLTKESRDASLRMGNAFMRIADNAVNDNTMSSIYKSFKKDGISYPVAYGIVMSKLNVLQKEALYAYVFNAVNAIVQSAVKLIPLGNTEAQTLILDMQSKMEAACENGQMIPLDDIVTFCPGLDIAGMEHENLSVRLYMT